MRCASTQYPAAVECPCCSASSEEASCPYVISRDESETALLTKEASLAGWVCAFHDVPPRPDMLKALSVTPAMLFTHGLHGHRDDGAAT